jgi:hypothetical protein
LLTGRGLLAGDAVPMRAALILPLAALIFLAGYITASYSIVNRVFNSATLLVLADVLFRVPTLQRKP